jgi:hypothetical protein
MILDMDANEFATGAVLSQVQNGMERVIAYASKALSTTQRVYCVTYKELLAVVTYIKHFRHYLLGYHFCVRTHHNTLRWLMMWKELDTMPARGMAKLSQFDFDIQHRRGVSYGNADGLSRRPLVPCKRACKRPDCPDCTRVIGPVGPGNNVPTASSEPSLCMDERDAPVSDNFQTRPASPEASSGTKSVAEEAALGWQEVWSEAELASMQQTDGNKFALKRKWADFVHRTFVKIAI